MTGTKPRNGPCECGWLEKAAAEPKIPIKFDAQMNEYSIIYATPGGGGAMIVRYCPWCGSPAPTSARGSFFARLTDAEIHRLEELTAQINTLEDTLRVLGAPDDDHPHGYGSRSAYREDAPQVAEFFRMLVYRKVSATADVHVVVESEDRVRVTFVGKYLGGTRSPGHTEPGSGG